MRDGWSKPALGLVALVTLIRLTLLAFDRTDLFVDESQYWLWGQDFAFGYFSKPPLIAWVIGASTAIGGDTPYFVRAPFALFHAATALVLAALAAHLAGPRVAILVAATYVTLPMAAVGSLLASTDTVMAPFFAAALYSHTRLTEDPRPRFALLTGLFLGLAFLAKYAALYFLPGAVLGALVLPAFRIGWRNAGLIALAFALVAAPNLIWNATHGFATLFHTGDNIGWIAGDTPARPAPLASLATFLGSQFAVAGPFVFAALLVAFTRPDLARLTFFAAPPLALVSLQALLGGANANWAAAAFFAGSIAAVIVLRRHPRLLYPSLALNGAVTLALPLLTLFPTLSLGGDPLLDRWTGQAAMSRQIIALSAAKGGLPIVSDRRDILADLFFTGATDRLTIYAKPPRDRPRNHYEQTRPMPATLTGPVLFIGTTARCPKAERLDLDPGIGSYRRAGLRAFVLDAGCLRAN